MSQLKLWITIINRKEPILNLPATIQFAVLLLVMIHLSLTYMIGPGTRVFVVFSGAFIPARFQAEPLANMYRLASYSLLHGSAGHLVNNCIWLVAFGSPVAISLGRTRFLLFWITCSAAAALLHCSVDSTSSVPMIGASGAVSGMMGALARAGFVIRAGDSAPQSRQSLPTIRQALSSKTVLGFLFVYLLINAGIGLGGAVAPELSAIAWQAHIGGMFAGFFLFPIFIQERS